MEPAEAEFLAEKELVTIVPSFSMDRVHLIGVCGAGPGVGGGNEACGGWDRSLKGWGTRPGGAEGAVWGYWGAGLEGVGDQSWGCGG